MSAMAVKPGIAIVTGASGQDGYFLTERLLAEGWTVHAISRHPEALGRLSVTDAARIFIHQLDLTQPKTFIELVKRVQPDEFYNLAGQSRVAESFSHPLYTWQTNAEAVVHLLELIRRESPQTRFYQASSTDMFGAARDGAVRHHELSALLPQSPYASAKAAAHLLCRSYREIYGLRIACGILSNHESHRRPASFLSRKVVDHVLRLKQLSRDGLRAAQPLVMGNLKIRRDWGFAPDYVDGMCRIIRQLDYRARQAAAAAEDDGLYRDYVLGTGVTHAVWEMVDCAFRLGGFALDWNLEGDEPASWGAHFSDSGKTAVRVDPALVRVAEPLVIEVDPSRATRDLGWVPRPGLEIFLTDMLNNL